MLLFLRLFECLMLIYLVLQIRSRYYVFKNWYILLIKLKLVIISSEIFVVLFIVCFQNIWTRFTYISNSHSGYDIFSNNSPWTRFSYSVGCILRVRTYIAILISSSKTCYLLLLVLNILNYSACLSIVSSDITSCKIISVVVLKIDLTVYLILILLFCEAFACDSMVFISIGKSWSSSLANLKRIVLAPILVIWNPMR